MFAIRRSVGILKGCRFAPRWHQFLNAFSTNVPPTTSQSSDSSKIRINTKYTEEEMITNDLLKALSLDTANSRTLLKARVQRTMDRFKLHNSDTGSSSVQIAILTQKIANLARHFASHRKDHASGRGFQAMVTRRRKLMQYLLRKDGKEFEKVVRVLGLEKEAEQILPQQRTTTVSKAEKASESGGSSAP